MDVGKSLSYGLKTKLDGGTFFSVNAQFNKTKMYQQAAKMINEMDDILWDLASGRWI